MKKATDIAEHLLNSDVDGLPKPSSAVLRAMGRAPLREDDDEKEGKEKEPKEPKDEKKKKDKAEPSSEPAGPVELEKHEGPGEIEPEEHEGPEAMVAVTVEALESDWRQATDDAARREVAARVLDGLEKYEDFVGLAYKLGQSDAESLARMMDDLAEPETPALVGKELGEISPADTLAALKLKATTP
jgi:hypothetical protein